MGFKIEPGVQNTIQHEMNNKFFIVCGSNNENEKGMG
jgi:hypothetical protein